MTTYKQSKFRIVNRLSGLELGIWEADSFDQAIDMCAEEAGYRNHGHMKNLIETIENEIEVQLLDDKGEMISRRFY